MQLLSAFFSPIITISVNGYCAVIIIIIRFVGEAAQGEVRTRDESLFVPARSGGSSDTKTRGSSKSQSEITCATPGLLLQDA